MRYLGYNVSATTIRHILEVNGIVPDPERRLRGDWSQFIETQQYVTTSTDFAQVERLGNVPNFVTEWRNLSEALNALN